MPDETILGQADALIRRYRSFVARSPNASDTPPEKTELSPDAEADIPLLTEVVAATADQPTALLIESMRVALENELDSWVGEILPTVVANASQGMLTELETQARHTLLPHLLEILENGTRQKL